MNLSFYFVMASLCIGAVTSHAATKHSSRSDVATSDSDLMYTPDDMADVDGDEPARVAVKKIVKAKKTIKPATPVDPIEPSEAGTSEPRCTSGCPPPVSSFNPLDVFKPVLRLFKPDVDLMALTGTHMSCAQKNLLGVAKARASRIYHNKNSGGKCGTGVGDAITAAGFVFASTGRNGVAYNRLLPKYGFTRTSARNESEAPDGTIMVYAGPCSPGFKWLADAHHVSCSPKNNSKGETFGHVTVKGSPSQDQGQQWYYTDGRMNVPKNKTRRFFLGAFLPPGWEKGPCR